MTPPAPAAAVVVRGGLPILEVGGRATPPVLFFFNTEVPSGQHFLEPQVRLSAEAGVHLYSLPVPWPWPGEDANATHEAAAECFDRILAADPDARFIPRIRCEGGEAWLEANPDECILYEDGSRPVMSSLASPRWRDLLLQGLRDAVARFESSPHGPRIIGYHPSGQNTSEWFHFEYWMRGPDYSLHNQEAFRRFLAGKHGSDEALARAWGREATLAEASIPRPWRRAEAYAHFHDPATEQDRLDFLEFTNAIVPERLEEIAATIKDACGRRKLVIAFYGYTMELKGSSHGHLGMGRVLRNPDIDAACSPLSYEGRGVGGHSGFMAAVDALPLHGKMWIVEDDTRTHRWTGDRLPHFLPPQDVGPICSGPEESVGVLKRTAAAAMAHGAGVWWMDLVSVGAFDAPEAWRFMQDEYLPACRALIGDPGRDEAELAIILDEASLRTVRDDFPGMETAANELSHHALFLNRDAFARCGVPVSFHLLDDFLEGLVPPVKVVLFPCCWNMDDHAIEQLRERLAASPCHAIWLHTAGRPPGFPGAEDAVARLTGLRPRLAADPPAAVAGRGALEGIRWGADLGTGPSWVFDPQDRVDVLGTAGSVAVAAHRSEGTGTSRTLLANPSISWEALGALAGHLGCHRYISSGESFDAFGGVLSIHGRGDEPALVRLPGGGRSTVPLERGRTLWIRPEPNRKET